MSSNIFGRVIEVCISNKKGTTKNPVGKAILKKNYGIVGDAHAGVSTRRQVSMLNIESIVKMKRYGYNFKPGDFAENITIEGIKYSDLSIGTILLVGSDVKLEITQIGKKCHSQCEIKSITSYCIMPKEGIFAKVIEGGYIQRGDIVKKNGTFIR